jgi:hypothetical protein
MSANLKNQVIGVEYVGNMNTSMTDRLNSAFFHISAYNIYDILCMQSFYCRNTSLFLIASS